VLKAINLGIISGIDLKRFTVHALGDGTAEVTEGGREFGRIWARERYDCSDPDIRSRRSTSSPPTRRWQ
jgi:hypothetical protein